MIPDELRKAVAELYLSGIRGSYCGVLVLTLCLYSYNNNNICYYYRRTDDF